MSHFATLFSSLQQQGLYFTEETLSNYLLALQTKRFVILSGISGTGKTQLALAVAKFCRKPVQVDTQSETPQHAIRMTAKPYNFKYHRLVMPMKLLRQMQIPEFKSGVKSGMVKVSYNGKETNLTLSGETTGTTHLLFNSAFRTWFDQNLKVNEQFFLDLVPGIDGPDGLRFDLPHKTKVHEELRDTYINIAVEPDWTDKRGVVGYYNPITQQYHVTPCLTILLEAAEEAETARAEVRDAYPYFLILDEMNLARVEHYFSDFLSCLESGEPLHLHNSLILEGDEEGAGLPVPQSLKIPSNLFFIGTVNVDETTSMFSPKVIDRAFTLEFNTVSLELVSPQ